MSIRNEENKLTNIKIAKVLSQKYSVDKKLGQNFLTSTRYLYKLVDSLEINPKDTIIEIGPGFGSVTEEVLNRVKKVVCFEIDIKKVEFLSEYFEDKIELINEDFLQIDFLKFLTDRGIDNYKVISSLPYNASKPILSKLLTLEKPPQKISVIIQKEVGHDMTAMSPRSTYLAQMTNVWCDVSSHGKIENWNFYPKPKVDGLILSFKIKNKYDLSYDQKLSLTKFLRIAFVNPRKQLHSVLKSIYPNVQDTIKQIDLKETIRSQEMDTEQWIKLWKMLHN